MAENANQESAALLLASGHSIAAAAERLEVNEKTIRRWLAAGLQGRVRQLRTELFGQAVGVLTTISSTAAVVLGKLLSSKSERVQLNAAEVVISAAMSAAEQADLRQQVEELQAQVAELKAGKLRVRG
jgi:hypothetical protein